MYVYAANGDLVGVVGVNGAKQTFAYDGSRMIGAFDDDGVPIWEAVFGDGIDQLLEYRDFGADPVVPLIDHRNSVVATWNPQSLAVDQLARYDAHGRLTLLDATESQLCVEQGTGEVCAAPSGMPFAFNGRWRSPATGLVNMRARWYSPRLAQFTAPDPLGYVDLYSLYGFASFDPINGWDPYGLRSFSFAQSVCQRDPICRQQVADQAERNRLWVDKQQKRADGGGVNVQPKQGCISMGAVVKCSSPKVQAQGDAFMWGLVFGVGAEAAGAVLGSHIARSVAEVFLFRPNHVPIAAAIEGAVGLRRVTEIRAGLTGKVGKLKRRNVGYAEYEIEGLGVGELRAVSGQRSPPGTVGGDAGQFTTRYTPDPVDRTSDVEFKVLSELATKIGDSRASGTVRLFTEKAPCHSCSGVIQEFKMRFPNIDLVVSHGGR